MRQDSVTPVMGRDTRAALEDWHAACAEVDVKRREYEQAIVRAAILERDLRIMPQHQRFPNADTNGMIRRDVDRQLPDQTAWRERQLMLNRIAELEIETERLERTLSGVLLDDEDRPLVAQVERLRHALTEIKTFTDRIIASDGKYYGIGDALEVSNMARRALR